MSISDKSLIIPPDVGGPLEGTLTISIDEIFMGLNSSKGLNIKLRWWGSDYSHYFSVGSFPENALTFYVHTKTALFRRYLEEVAIKFKLLDGKSYLGSAVVSDVESILSKKLYTTVLPVNDDLGCKIADLKVTFKYSLVGEDEEPQVGSSAPNISVSKIVDNTNKIRSQIATAALAECDSSLFMKRLPFDEFKSKSQEAKVIDYIQGTYPTGTEFIFEYHPISSLGKSWFRPFILTAKQFDQNVVKFNEYMISKIKNSPDPWKVVNELCEGSEIKVYWKHSNEKLPSLLGATKYPSDSPTENFSKNLCLPLYTKYKLHVGNLLMKVELGSDLVFGKALVSAKAAEPRGKTSDQVTFRSMSEDSNIDKVPKILSKNAVTFVDKSETKKMLKTQFELLDDQLSENLLMKQGRSRSEVKNSNQDSDLQDEVSNVQTDEPNSSSSHTSLGLDSVSNLKPYSKPLKVCPSKLGKKNRKKTKLEHEQVINVESGSSLQSSPERKAKKKIFPKTPTTLHVFKFYVDESNEFFDDSLEFFLEYKFPNVDSNFNVFLDPKIHRIDLGFSHNTLIHRLVLPENLSLSQAFENLEKEHLSIKLFARSITKRTFLISQCNISLEKISFHDVKRHCGGQIVKIPWKLDSTSIPKGVNIPVKEMNLEVFYVKNPKESDAQTELEYLEEKLTESRILREFNSKNWRDEFKEPLIIRDPITGEPRSSRVDSKYDSELLKLQEKCEFPPSNGHLDDFRPSRPSFLSEPDFNGFPEGDIIDLDKTSIVDNPFETPAELRRKQHWMNEEFKSDSFSTLDQTEIPTNQNIMHELINDKTEVLVLSAGIDGEIERSRQFEDFSSKRDQFYKLPCQNDEEADFRSKVCDEVIDIETKESLKNFDEIIELSSEDEDNIPEAEDADTSVINMEIEQGFQENKPFPKNVRVNIEVESALNLLVAVCKEKSTDENTVKPTSRVELTIEVKGKKIVLKSPWVEDAKAPLYNFSEDISLPSDMFLKRDNELEINVRAKVKGETYLLKTLIDLTVISAGKMGLKGVYFLHLGTRAQGILLVNIRPLDDLNPLREAWENNYGMIPPPVENFISELDQFEEHYTKNLSEMHSMVEEMEDMLENEDWKRPNQEKLKKIMSFKSSSPTCLPSYIKKYTETLDDNWTTESILNNKKKPSDDEFDDVKKVIDDLNNVLDVDFDYETTTNQPKDSLEAAANSIDKLIQELRKRRIDE